MCCEISGIGGARRNGQHCYPQASVNRRKQSKVRFDASHETLHSLSPASSPETSKSPRFSEDAFAHASVLKGAASTGRAYRGPR